MTELMVAVVVVTIGVLGLMQSFIFISRSLRISRQRTIADNLAQEKIESLKQLSYSQILVTTSPYVDEHFDPALVYDAANYPPETLSLWGGAPLTRAVRVSFAAVIGDSVVALPWTNADPGLKMITVYVLWNQDGEWRKISLTNLIENPNVSALDSTISGAVRDHLGAPLPGALVQVVGSRQWQAAADASGAYAFNVSAGSYTLNASLANYYPQMSGTLSAAAGGSVVQDFTLLAVASGAVSSDSVYINRDLLVSQVVASTVTLGGDMSVHDVEYVELFNPTPDEAAIGTFGAPAVKLNYLAHGGLSRLNMPLTYVSTSVPPGGYYLIANGPRFFVRGAWVNADAYYAPPLASYQDVILADRAGAVQIEDSGGVIDGVGWSLNAGQAAPWSEGPALTVPSGGPQNGQLVRMSSACALDDAYGRAYDSDDNADNFFYADPLTYAPGTTAAWRPVIAGTPAVGGHAVADDGKSAAAGIAAVFAHAPPPSTQTCPDARFTIAGVAAGNWTVEVTSGSFAQTVSNVSVAQGATTAILNGATSPPRPYGFAHVALTTTSASGYIAGTVVSVGGAPLAGIAVSGGGASVVTHANGSYFLSTTDSLVNLTANPNNADPHYVAGSALVSVVPGEVAYAYFVLSQGGVIRGQVTTGLSPLVGCVVAASGPSQESAATDSTGWFYIENLTTGTYAVAPALDSNQTSSPPSVSVTLTAPGAAVSAGVFTVGGAYAVISGSVAFAGRPITTGVLVVASSSTVPAPAPAVYASSAASHAPYYAATSRADGTYSVLVRGSTTYVYNVRAYYPVVDLNTGAVTNSSRLRAAVSAAPGAAVPGVDFEWP